MATINLNIDIEDSRWQKEIPEIYKVAEDVKNTTISFICEQKDSDIFEQNKNIFINLCLSDDARVHALNKTFRGKDSPTNVLSFANIDFENFTQENNLYSEIELGDIIIAYETMCKESKIENISLHDHFCHLFVHGILHLLGYDHIEAKEAEQMEGYEIAILKKLNISNPYEEA